MTVQGQLFVLLDATDIGHGHAVGDIHGAALELDGPVDALGHGPHHELLVGRLLAPVVIISLEDDPVALVPALELEGARAHGIHAVGLTAGLDGLLVHDASPGVAQGHEEGGERSLQPEDDGVVIHDLHLVDNFGILADGASDGSLGAFDGVLDVFRRERLAVVEFHALAESELVGNVVNLLPFLGEHGDEVVLLVEGKKGVVDVKAHSGGGHLILDDGVQGAGVVNVGHDKSILRQRGNGKKAQKNCCGYCQKRCLGAGVSFHSVISFDIFTQRGREKVAFCIDLDRLSLVHPLLHTEGLWATGSLAVKKDTAYTITEPRPLFPPVARRAV